MKLTFDIGRDDAITNVADPSAFQLEGYRIVNLVHCPKHEVGIMVVMKEELLDERGAICLLQSARQLLMNLRQQLHMDEDEDDNDFIH